MSNSVWPHRWQPIRLPHPWDPPGKKTGVGCHFLLQCIKVKSESEVAQSCPTLSDPMDCSLPGSSINGIFQARVLEWVVIAFSVSRSIGSLQWTVSVNYRVLYCLTCHFQCGSLFFVYFGFLRFQFFSVSNFHPDTREWRWSLISAHLFSCVVGREGHYK